MGLGHFITIEGGEGTGKSTQINHLIDRLRALRIDGVKTREPGGSPGAERIRALILTAEQARFDPLTEILLFFAARNDHLQHVIRPALIAGKWVICDRFSDSTRVYQGGANGLEGAVLDQIDQWVVRDTQPELTLILDLPVEIGLARAKARRGNDAADGFEAESIGFHQTLREAYLALARSYPERCVVIDAEGDEEAVAERIWRVVSERFLLTHGVNPHG